LSTQAFVGALGAPDAKAIPEVLSRVEYAAGRLLFLREGTLLAQPFDLGTYRLTGTATPVSELVHGFASTGFGAFSATERLLVFQAGLVSNRLVWFDRTGRALESVGPAKEYIGARISSDGSSVAASARDPLLGTTDIWVQDLKRNITRHFTNDKGIENIPAWSPDGRTLVYAADRRGPPHMHARDVGGSEEREIAAPMPLGPQSQPSFTPDGRSVLFTAPAPNTGADIFIVPVDGRAPPVPLIHSKARETGPRASPNGRWLAYTSDESGRVEVYVTPFDADHPRVQISRAGGTNARWRADSREVFYTEGGARVIAADVAASPVFEVGALRVVFEVPGPFADYDVTADGQRFLFIMRDREAEAGTLSAILNWPAMLKK
jgi:dipeptidyl aminopeptidase/acylaminoacyl peptidase